jgi:Zn-dependent peptidase ImmA (M78 family)
MNYQQFLAKSTSAYDLLQYLQEQGQDISIPIDLEKVVQFLGITYNNKPDFKKFKTVGSIQKNPNGVEIWVNPIENAFTERKRFTIAHELGHLMSGHLTLKPLINDDVISLNRDDNWDELEMQANGFAAQFLMPVEKIKEKIKEFTASTHQTPDPQWLTEQLADFFKVSKIAMEFRLNKLGAL